MAARLAGRRGMTEAVEHMLTIETKGTWREMGRQHGEEFATPIREALRKFSPWLGEDLAKYQPAIEELRQTLAPLCGDLLEETAGMAEGAGLDEPLLLGFRFFHEIRMRMGEGCSALYLSQAAEGPLLGRNCDLSEGFEAAIQVCQVLRPRDCMAAIRTNYVGLAGGIGVNEAGFGTGGASAHTDMVYGDEGLPGCAILHLLLHGCRSLREARELLADMTFLGKPMNLIAGDAGGESVLLEFAPGRPAVQTPRRDGRNWQACTNFFMSGEIPIASDAAYLQSPYARYGRIAHQLDWGLAEQSVDGVKRLLTDVAQPGPLLAEETCTIKTAYSQVCDLAGRVMHLSPGHPEQCEWREVAL